MGPRLRHQPLQLGFPLSLDDHPTGTLRSNRRSPSQMRLYTFTASSRVDQHRLLPGRRRKRHAELAHSSFYCPRVPSRVQLTETVSSASARVGQAVHFDVVDPVEQDGAVVVAAQSPVRAVVTARRTRGRNQREGTLQLTLQSVLRVVGTQAPLRSAALKQGGRPGPLIFGPCTFPFPADPVGLFHKGQDVIIPKRNRAHRRACPKLLRESIFRHTDS